MRRSRLLVLSLVAAAARAVVDEVTTQTQFQKALSDNMAVVVDFYSQTCGPCIMMAPTFKEVAREYEGRVKFIKVDVQRSYVGVQVRSMPTFHFYLQGKLSDQFSGADEGGLRRMAATLARKAEEMDVEVSLGALEAFYKKYDESKLDNIDELYEKYPAYKLVAILKKKYGAAPEHTKKKPARRAPPRVDTTAARRALQRAATRYHATPRRAGRPSARRRRRRRASTSVRWTSTTCARSSCVASWRPRRRRRS